MKKWIFALGLMLLPTWAWGGDFYTQTDFMRAEELKAPVGIDFDATALYVSSMGPTYHKESDGYIIRHDLATGENKLLLQNQINSPKSFEVLNGQIIFIDPYADKDAGTPFVLVADIAKNEIIGRVALPGDGYPFDIASIDENLFVVSDSKLNQLYLITVDGAELTAEVWAQNIPGAKGIAHFEDCIYVAGTASNPDRPDENIGMVYQVNERTREVTEYQAVKTPAGTLNAVIFHNGYMFAGDWGSKKQESVSVYVYHIQELDFVTELKDVAPMSDWVFRGDDLYMAVMTGEKVVKLAVDFAALENMRPKYDYYNAH